jgi:hypothetical protein
VQLPVSAPAQAVPLLALQMGLQRVLLSPAPFLMAVVQPAFLLQMMVWPPVLFPLLLELRALPLSSTTSLPTKLYLRAPLQEASPALSSEYLTVPLALAPALPPQQIPSMRWCH